MRQGRQRVPPLAAKLIQGANPCPSLLRPSKTGESKKHPPLHSRGSFLNPPENTRAGAEGPHVTPALKGWGGNPTTPSASDTPPPHPLPQAAIHTDFWVPEQEGVEDSWAWGPNPSQPVLTPLSPPLLPTLPAQLLSSSWAVVPTPRLVLQVSLLLKQQSLPTHPHTLQSRGAGLHSPSGKGNFHLPVQKATAEGGRGIGEPLHRAKPL